MVSIKLVNLTKRFGNVTAVDNLNLEIKDGEFVAFLGPSGCGKTTTLLMIAGIYKPTSGKIFFDERDVTKEPPWERNIGMVFQSYALYPHMTVYENIAFPLKLKKLPKEEIDRRVKWAAELLQIEELLDRKPGQLSGGQQQRVALARALVKYPDVLLLDEPLSNLDAILRVRMRSELKKLQRKLKITTIYVTHDQVEAMSMAHRIAVMNKGRLQQYDEPMVIYDKPANTFVATFVGSPPMNLIPGWLENGYFVAEGNGIRVRLNEELYEYLKEKAEEVYLGIRPENVKVDGGEDAEGVISVIEPLGKEVLLHINVGKYEIKVVDSPEKEYKVGQRVRVHFDRNKLRFFDRRTEKLIT